MMDRRKLLTLAASTPLAMPFIRRASAAPATVTLAAYGGIFRDHYQKVVIDPFEAAHPDIKVQYYQMNNSAQNLGTIRGQKAAPQIDLSILDVTLGKGGTDEELFKPVTPAELPVLDELYPQAIIEGVAGPAVTFDSVELIFSPERVTPEPTSWDVLWNPDYTRQIGIGGMPSLECIALLFILSGQQGRIEDYDAAIESGFQKLELMVPHVLTWDPRPDAGALIVGGGSSLGVMWNARSQTYALQNEGKLGVASPIEGSTLQINTINLVNGAPQEEAARVFLAYALGREAQSAFTEAMFYAPVNARAEVAPDALARTIAAPEKMARVIEVDWIKVAGLREGILQQWRRRVITQ